MKLHWLVVLVPVFLLSAASSVSAAEPYLEFVDGLRKRDYHDYALLYLEKLEKRADVPAEIKEVIPFEKGITLVDGARRLHNPEAQTKQLDQARVYLEQFLKASPNHPQAGLANAELAKVIVEKGKVEVIQSRSPANVAQKAEHQKKARAFFADARKVYKAAHDRYKEAYEKFGSHVSKEQKAKHDAWNAAFSDYVQAQLNLVVLTYEEAQTWDKGTPENRKLLSEAASGFEQIHARYRQMIAGLYARMWQGKCFEEQDDITKALGVYNELLEHGGEKPDRVLKNMQDRVRHFKLVCLNREQRKDYQVVIQEAQDWIKENRSLLSTRTGLGIQWELVRAQELLAKKEETGEAEKNRLLQQALTTARAINRFPGEFRDVSSAMIERLKVDLNREPGDPKDFPTAFATARNLIQEISKLNRQMQEARGSEYDRLVADLQPILKEAGRILTIGLSLTSPKDDSKDVNQARYFLSYVYFSMRDSTLDRSYDAAVLAEYVARKSTVTQPELAQDAAFLAEAAYIQAYRRQPEEHRAGDIKRIIGVCNFIAANWPDSDKANDARMDLGKMYSEVGQPGEAAKWLMQVPESAPRYLEAQLEAGNAFWYAYLAESVRPEAERKPQEELDGLLKQSQEILRTALAKFESQLPGDISQVDETKLGNLTRAKLNYSQILNGSGDYQKALAMLTDGNLSVVAAVAPPGGDEKQRPARGSIKSRLYAGAVYQVLLRTYVGMQNLDKARETMRDLERIVGAGGGGASLTRIYLDLGRELQKEVERLQAARDRRLSEVLKSFETFLEDMSNRKDGQDFNSLIWVAETYRSLGEGLQQGDTTKAESYFGKAVDALQLLLNEDAKKPGFIPAGQVVGVKLRLVTCKRLQKDFNDAHKVLVAVLSEKPKAPDVQKEAAFLFQDWAARGGPKDADKWLIAIEGGAKSKDKDDRRVWGWFGLSEKLRSYLQSNPSPDYEQQFLDASYNVADCWYKYATADASDAARKKHLAEAYKAVQRPAVIIPHLGGGETWARFNTLYRKIQEDMLDLGMEQMRGREVVDFEKRKLTKEERAALRQSQAGRTELALAEADEPLPEKPRPKKSGTTGPAKPKNGSNTGMIALGILLLAGGGAAAWYYLFRTKKPKRHTRIVRDEPDLNFDEPRTPSARTKS